MVFDVLDREYGSRASGAKILAKAASVSCRTAENWLQGLCAPRGDTLIRLNVRMHPAQGGILAPR